MGTDSVPQDQPGMQHEDQPAMQHEDQPGMQHESGSA